MRSRILIFLGLIPLCFGCAGTSPQTIQADINTSLADVSQTAAVVASTAGRTSAAVNSVEASVITSEQSVSAIETVAYSITQDAPVQVQVGDTLWSLCVSQYTGSAFSPDGGGYLWPLVASRNALADPNLILPGQVIRFIPANKLSTLPSSQILAALNTAYQTPAWAREIIQNQITAAPVKTTSAP